MNRALIPLLFLTASVLPAQYKSVNPQVEKVLSEISDEHITEILKKLESFGTRNLLSSQDNPTRGIGAARKWIYAQFQSYSPKLEVSYDQYRLKKVEGRASRVPRDTDLYNVVAVLPGTTNKEQRIIISGHYDSIVLGRPTGGAPLGPGETSTSAAAPPPMRDPDLDAPGVDDDGSGVACVMELARVLSHYEFEKTLVFIAFAGEEEGLFGSTLYAQKARSLDQKIEAVLNNDIIGSNVSGTGRIDNRRVNVFSADPDDSPSRELARYVREIGERYLPAMQVDTIFREDRFGRGGDHTPFNQEGFAAIRFSSPEENFANQHSVTDTLANMSVPDNTLVTKVNAAAAASLAWAPKAPVTSEVRERNGQKVTTLFLTRGKSRYDAALKWTEENPEADLAGYVVVYRSTTSPYWEHEIFVGKTNEYTLTDVSIDDLVFGVKAIDKDGNESLVSPYVQAPRAKRKIETY